MWRRAKRQARQNWEDEGGIKHTRGSEGMESEKRVQREEHGQKQRARKRETREGGDEKQTDIASACCMLHLLWQLVVFHEVRGDEFLGESLRLHDL